MSRSARGSALEDGSGMDFPPPRALFPDEHDAWLALRKGLWPETPLDVLGAERAEILADPAHQGVLVIPATGGGLLGFVEVSLRDWAEGCSTRGVGYLEAWYVVPTRRGQGLGRALVAAAGAWARARGASEMASDADLVNETSHAAHAALGFAEVARIVLYRKPLS